MTAMIQWMGKRNYNYFVIIRHLYYLWGDMMFFENGLELAENVHCKL